MSIRNLLQTFIVVLGSSAALYGQSDRVPAGTDIPVRIPERTSRSGLMMRSMQEVHQTVESTLQLWTAMLPTIPAGSLPTGFAIFLTLL